MDNVGTQALVFYKKIMMPKKRIICTVFLLFGIFNLYSQTPSNSQSIESVSQIYIETDPTAFFFNGFSLALRRSGTFSKNLNIGIGIYKTQLPTFYIESVASNKGKGWEANNIGLDGFIDYHIFDPNKGLSVGLTFSVYKFNLERNNKKSSYNSLVETIRVGYLWRPIKKFDSLYIFPWVGVSTGQTISGTNKVDGETFNTPDWSIVPAFQIGYSF